MVKSDRLWVLCVLGAETCADDSTAMSRRRTTGRCKWCDKDIVTGQLAIHVKRRQGYLVLHPDCHDDAKSEIG